MRITKKIASEIFKKVVGTDKGMEKFQRGIEDIWVIKLGVITTILRDELKYDLFGNRVEGKYWILFCLQQILNLLFFVKNSQNLITNNPIKQSNPRNSKHSRCQKRDCIQTYIN